MRARILLTTLALVALPALADTDSKVVEKIEHTDSRHTSITIKDYRKHAARPARAAAEPAFKEYDLAPVHAVAPAPVPHPVARANYAPVPMMQSYSQTYAPGPNTGMAANGFVTPGGANILSTGPIYGYGYGYGFGDYGYGYSGYAGYPGYGYGYGMGGRFRNSTYYPGIYSPLATYSNGLFINQPQQRFNPPPGAAFPVIPQSYTMPGYVTPGGFFRPVGGGRGRGRR